METRIHTLIQFPPAVDISRNFHIEPLMNNHIGHITAFTPKSNPCTWLTTHSENSSFNVILPVASPDFYAEMEVKFSFLSSNFTYTHTYTNRTSLHPSYLIITVSVLGFFLFMGHFLWNNELFNTKRPQMVADELIHWRRILIKKTRENWE